MSWSGEEEGDEEEVQAGLGWDRVAGLVDAVQREGDLLGVTVSPHVHQGVAVEDGQFAEVAEGDFGGL